MSQIPIPASSLNVPEVPTRLRAVSTMLCPRQPLPCPEGLRGKDLPAFSISPLGICERDVTDCRQLPIFVKGTSTTHSAACVSHRSGVSQPPSLPHHVHPSAAHRHRSTTHHLVPFCLVFSPFLLREPERPLNHALLLPLYCVPHSRMCLVGGAGVGRLFG